MLSFMKNLADINTNDGEHEDMSVTLMGVMMACGIPEIIGDGSGIMVEEKNAEAIADALEKLIKDRDYRYEMCRKGRFKVEKEFDIEKNVKILIELVKK